MIFTVATTRLNMVGGNIFIQIGRSQVWSPGPGPESWTWACDNLSGRRHTDQRLCHTHRFKPLRGGPGTVQEPPRNAGGLGSEMLSDKFYYLHCFYWFKEEHTDSPELNLLVEIDEILLKGKTELNFI